MSNQTSEPINLFGVDYPVYASAPKSATFNFAFNSAAVYTRRNGEAFAVVAR